MNRETADEAVGRAIMERLRNQGILGERALAMLEKALEEGSLSTEGCYLIADAAHVEGEDGQED